MKPSYAQCNKDNEFRYRNVNINNYRQDKKEYIPDQIKAALNTKKECSQGFISKFHSRKK